MSSLVKTTQVFSSKGNNRFCSQTEKRIRWFERGSCQDTHSDNVTIKRSVTKFRYTWCEPSIAVIELDDSSHRQKKRQERDHYVNSVLEGQHPLLRFEARSHYDKGHLIKVIERDTDIKCKEYKSALQHCWWQFSTLSQRYWYSSNETRHWKCVKGSILIIR